MNNINQCGVYKIVCLINGKTYYGSSVNVSKRMCAHKSLLREGVHSPKGLQDDFKKHGIDNFLFEPVQFFKEIREAFAHEVFLIRRDIGKGILYNKFTTDKFSRTEEVIARTAEKRRNGCKHAREKLNKEYFHFLATKSPIPMLVIK